MNKVPHFLHVLLTADCDSREYRRAVVQLERRPELHPILEGLATGDSTWLSDARSILAEAGLPKDDDCSESSILIEVESSLGEDDPIDIEQVQLDFLGAASHPELLGRLDRYNVERVLGTGGMGVVLRAFDTDLHRVVAIKVLAPHLANSSSARRRFAREARAAAAVVHPHVIPIFNVQSDARVPYLVMQYVAGHSLQRRVDMQGPLAIADALRIAQQTAAGLSAAHGQGLVHRDVKPANILLLEDKVDHVLLSDFGLARTVDDASLTKTGIVAGTPHYMSPEQALGEPIDHRSDLFSLGSVLYFMLTGRPPYRASGAMAVLHRICHTQHRPAIEVNRDVPKEVSRLIDRLLAKSAASRIQTAAIVERELVQLLSELQKRGVSIRNRSEITGIGQSARQALQFLKHNLHGIERKSVAIWGFIALAVALTVVGIVSLGNWLQLAEKNDLQQSTIGKAHVAPNSVAPLPTEPRVHTEDAATAPNLEEFLASDADFFRTLQALQNSVMTLSISPSGSSSCADQFESQVQEIQRALDSLSNQP